MRRPDDECPYQKPFPEGFDDCPAYQARQFIPLDTRYQPLEPVLTCRHLETRSLPQRHRWYAACVLGSGEARRRWVREVGAQRLGRIRAIQQDLGKVIAPFSKRLWQLKGQQLRAIRDGKDTGAVTAELRRVANQATEDLRVFLAQRGQELADIDIPVDVALRLIQTAFDRFIETRFAAEISFEVPDDVLRRFPEPVQSFFRPSARERPAVDR